MATHAVVLQYKTPIGAMFSLHVLILFFLFIIFCYLLYTVFYLFFFISDGCASESYVGNHFSRSIFENPRNTRYCGVRVKYMII